SGAKRRTHDLLQRGVDQPVVHVEQAISGSQQANGEGQHSYLLADTEVSQRCGAGGCHSRNQHAAAGAAIDDGIAPEAAQSSAQHTADKIDNSGSDSGGAYFQVEDPSE